jgi:penicillin-binding protein 2
MSTPIERVRPSWPIPDDRSRIPVSPQLALRVAVLGGGALLMFAIIFFRLWYLQVLSGEQYVQQANANSVRELPIAAPRGQILAREGQPIVTSRITNAVQIVPSALPPAGRPRLALYRRLGALLGVSPKGIEALVIKGRTAVPYAPVTIKTDAGRGVLTELAERQNEYPGVTQQPVSIRSYPFGEMAAQALGYVGSVSKEELASRAFRGVQQGTVVGQAGLEYYYDRYLRGQPGVQRVQVNSAGYPEPSDLKPTQPLAGHSLRVTLDLPLQHEGEIALRDGIGLAHADGYPGNGGAFMAMNPLNGEILATGSYPSFNPNQLAKPLTEAELKAIEGGPSEAPLTDRATEGAYPTGSSFKPITAIASLEAGILNPNEGLGAGACIEAIGGGGELFCNSGHDDYGAVGLVEALKVSSDTYFFTVGEMDNGHGNVIQNMAKRLGIGEPNNLDLPSETTGTVPTPQWRAQRNKLQEQCLRHHPASSCGYVAEIRPWEVGDNMDLAVGQGDLQTNPLQMAVAYSTLANAYMNGGNGTVVTPHLGMAVDETNGGLVQTLNFPPVRSVHFNYSNLSLVMEGIHDATSETGGTSADVWSGWNQAQYPVYGKTGTAERPPQVEQAWYMCIIPNPKRPIVIAVTIEQGGFGDQTAAPVARLIASKWFNQPLKLVSGSSADK